MPFLPFSQGKRNLYRLSGPNLAQVFIAFIVLLFSLTVWLPSLAAGPPR